jgi:hypothetical protein
MGFQSSFFFRWAVYSFNTPICFFFHMLMSMLLFIHISRYPSLSSQPCNSSDRHLNNLINPLIRRNIQLILLRHALCQKPPTHKMPPLKPLDQRLWRRQTNQRIRIIFLSRSFVWRPSFYIPTTRGIDSQDGDFCGGEGGDDGRKGFADLAFEGEAEDGVDDEIGLGELGVEV